MRKTLFPLVLIAASGCSMFSNPGSTMESTLVECTEKYEEWADAVRDIEDEEAAAELFSEIMDTEASWTMAYSHAQLDINGAHTNTEGPDRQEQYEELVELLEDLQNDCEDAREDFQEELGGEEEACKGWGAWAEEQYESWEDYRDALDDYEEDCDDDGTSRNECVRVRIAQYWNNVPGPIRDDMELGLTMYGDDEGGFDEESCE